MSSEKKPQPVAYRRWSGHGCGYYYFDAEGFSGDIKDPLYSEATIEALRAERDELRLAIAGVDPTYFDTDSLRQGQYVEMAADTERGRQYALERAETAEARVAQLEAALEPIQNASLDVSGTALIMCKEDKASDVRRRARALLSDGGAGV